MIKIKIIYHESGFNQVNFVFVLEMCVILQKTFQNNSKKTQIKFFNIKFNTISM